MPLYSSDDLLGWQVKVRNPADRVALIHRGRDAETYLSTVGANVPDDLRKGVLLVAKSICTKPSGCRGRLLTARRNPTPIMQATCLNVVGQP